MERRLLVLIGAWLLALTGCAGTPSSPSLEGRSLTAMAMQDRPPTIDELTEPFVVRMVENDDYLFAQTHVNRRDVGLFMLDTGSNLNAITNGVANRLELPKGSSHQVTGVGGRENFTYRRIDSIHAGRLQLAADELAGLNLHQLHRYDRMSVSGILGYHAFDPHPFTIDYADKTLTIHPTHGFVPPADAYAQRYVELAGLPVIVGTLANDQKILLLVDTGAGQNVAMCDLFALQPGVLAVTIGGHHQTMGIGGVIAGSRSWLNTLTVFGRTLRHVDVSLEPQASALRTEQGYIGRIGNKLLKNWRLTFDPQNKMLYAQWRPQ